MSKEKKDYNYNITQTFYAKWILPFVLIIIGTLLIIFFFPGMKFKKGVAMIDEQKVDKVFYVTKIEGVESYIEVKEKYIYETRYKGSYEYYYNTDIIYDKHIPYYSSVRMNLSSMGSAGGIGLSVVGIFMIFVNTFNKISTVKPKKDINKTKDSITEDDSIDEEDDE